MIKAEDQTVKATDLGIGNWIGHKSYPNMIVRRISEVEVDLDMPESESDYWSVTIDELRGIELNEEWLIKLKLDNVPFGDFGFIVASHGHEYVIEQQGDWFFIGIRPDNGSIVYFVWNIYYVHELQNIYRDLTGTELTTKP